MTLPDSAAYGTVTGQFYRGSAGVVEADVPTDLRVRFRPGLQAGVVRSGTAGALFAVDEVTATVDSSGQLLGADGAAGVRLLASMSPDLTPSGWTWTVVISSPTLAAVTFAFVLEVAQTIDLATVLQVPPNPGATLDAWLQAASTAQAARDEALAAAASVAAGSAAAIQAAIDALVGAAPEALNTLQEIDATIAADEGSAAALAALVGTKAPRDSPTFTGTVAGITPGMVGADPAGAAAAAQAASLQKTANLTDVASPSAARTALGLGTAATHPATDFDPAGAAAAVTKTSIGLSNVDNTADTAKPVSTAQAAALALKADAASVAATQLTDISATITADGPLTIGLHNPVDATAGARIMSLADASGAGRIVTVEKKDASTNTVTVNVAHLRDGGAGSLVLVGQYEAIVLKSKVDGTWWPLASHKTKAYLDKTYSALSGDVARLGREYDGPALPNLPILQKSVRDDTFPSSTNLDCSYKEWQHNASKGYIIHLTAGPGMANNGPALLGMGIDNGGRGLFVNNKKTGQGIVITQNSTITGTDAYGMLVNAGKGAAPAIWIQQDPGVGAASYATAMVLFAYQAVDNSQKLIEWRRPDGTTSGTLAGWVRAADGAFLWQSSATFTPKDVNTVPMTVQGLTSQVSNLQEWYTVGAGTVATMSPNGSLTLQGTSQSTGHTSSGAGSYLSVYDTSGTAGTRRFRMAHSTGYLALQARNDDGTSARDLLYLKHADRSLGLMGSLSFGGGSGVIAIGNATTVPTTNPTGGIVQYIDAGVMKWRDPNGVVTQFNRPTVTGSRASGAALTSLLSTLAAMNLIVDSSTA